MMLCKRGDELQNMKVSTFRNYMNNDTIMEECAQKVYENNFKDLSTKKDYASTINEIKELLSVVDKYLFVMFRDKQITLD